MRRRRRRDGSDDGAHRREGGSLYSDFLSLIHFHSILVSDSAEITRINLGAIGAGVGGGGGRATDPTETERCRLRLFRPPSLLPRNTTKLEFVALTLFQCIHNERTSYEVVGLIVLSPLVLHMIISYTLLLMGKSVHTVQFVTKSYEGTSS